jgi:hypothetical protein
MLHFCKGLSGASGAIADVQEKGARLMLDEALKKRYSGALPGDANVRSRVLETWRWFSDAGLAEQDGETRLASPDDTTYWQQLSEVLVSHQLSKVGLLPVRRPNSPDFLIEHDGQGIWIEVICPEPMGISEDWLKAVPGNWPREPGLFNAVGCGGG